MQPTLLHKPEIILVGMSFYGDPFDSSGEWMEENHIGRTWKRLMACLTQHGEAIQHQVSPGVAYEVHIYGEETMTEGRFEVFVGVAVERLDALPVNVVAKILPATQYAVFTFEGEAILSDWVMHIDQWLMQAGLERAHLYSVQYYDERFKGMDRIAESTLEVWMPVCPVAA